MIRQNFILFSFSVLFLLLSPTVIAQYSKANIFMLDDEYFTESFSSKLDGKTVVAMGEATHGTHEFFELKKRMFRYLVAEKGFTVFALEANYIECLPIDHYIKTGKGDPAHLLAKMMLWPWKTEEVLDLILWMRTYNIKKNKPVLSFIGIDPGNGIFLGIPHLSSYISEQQPALADEWKNIVSIHDSIKTMEQRDACSGLVSSFASKVSDSCAVFILRIIVQNLSFYFKDAVDVYKVRDLHMAENLLSLKGREKAFVWAHNAHVNMDPSFFGNRWKDASRPDVKAMGFYLRQKLHDSVYIIGFEFDHGSFLVNYFSEPQKKRVYKEISLSAAGQSTMSFQLKRISSKPFLICSKDAPAFLNRLLPSDNYGGGDPGSERSLELVNLVAAYDAIAFFPVTTPSRPLEGPL
ncbi:erythromycin esterase family protein [Terrimonas sp. NA20]|uniref:Erythromycin esterase family protein n=1 Tax=Terrimonas ginsenosidimutans TaxID=2908004 RepID=A0ABS9KRJ7_9BACT|nr:erythromycin esterase family protein [Terrimonas ginsenosidimutans]MCG2614967.1 erythromycin esterase family protein [Terrimonas ginsenosidimutans]